MDNRTEKRKIGDIGENIACKFLVKRGFEIIEKNYNKKWGEIDIIARKGQKLHFVEVKSVTHLPASSFGAKEGETDNYKPKTNLDFVRPTNHQNDWFRPEDNLHPWKLKRLSRVIQTYLLGYDSRRGACPAKLQRSGETDWQFDVAVVYLDLKSMEAKVNYMEDIIL